MHDIVDWRPFDYVTWHIRLPMGAIVRQMAELTPLENGGTHLSLRCAKPEGPQPGGDSAGADDHPARHGQEAGQRSTRLEGSAGAVGSGGERGVHLAPAHQSASAIHLQRGNERFLRDVDLAELPHLLLAFLLLLQKLAFAREAG